MIALATARLYRVVITTLKQQQSIQICCFWIIKLVVSTLKPKLRNIFALDVLYVDAGNIVNAMKSCTSGV